MDFQTIMFICWAIVAFAFMILMVVFAVWERNKLTNAEIARAGSLVPEIYIVQEDYEEVLGRGYTARRNR